MGISELFTKSFQDFKKNFKLNLKLCLWFVFIASIPFYLTLSAFQAYFPDSKMGTNVLSTFAIAAESFSGPSLAAWIVVLVFFGIIYFLLQFIFSISVIYGTKYNNNGKMKFSEAARGGLRSFWKYILYMLIVFCIFILLCIPSAVFVLITIFVWNTVGLTMKIILILIIALIFLASMIFAIYIFVRWIFTPFIFTGEKISIIDSTKQSWNVLTGNWWMTFAYLLLVGIIACAVYSAVWMVSLAITFIIAIPELLLAHTPGSGFLLFILYSLSAIVRQFFNSIYSLTASVFVIIFIKNLYSELKTKRK